MKFIAKLQQMADNEIRAMIPPYYLEDIKRRDPKPLFKAFIIGQEGEAEGKWVGVGKVVKTWFKDAIGKLARKIYAGLKIFSGHAETNEHEGRMQIGEVAGSRVKTIDGKFSAMIAAYIFPEYKNMPLDVASIEADINVHDASGDIHAVDVNEITGIALGNSAVEKPGFPGATLLGELQAFANGRSQFNKGGGNMPTIEEIKKFVGEEGISPSEIFGQDSLIDDPIVKGYVDAERKHASSGEYSARKRNQGEFEELKKKLEEDKKKLEDENKELKTESAKVKAADLFSTKAKERKLDKKQAEFISAKQGDFIPQNVDELEKEVDAFVDKRLEEYKETAKIFGVGVKEEKEEKSKGGGEPGEGGSGEENELIPD